MSEITFKRFPESKQEQIRQFVAYAQMCGLSGKDIRSIGDKLDRQRKVSERQANMEIVKGFECLSIGDDAKKYDKKYQLNQRFKLKTANGAYNFVYNWGGYTVTSLKTKKTVSHKTDIHAYELPVRNYDEVARYATLLDIAFGKLKLNF
jgi:hypothetical protein